MTDPSPFFDLLDSQEIIFHSEEEEEDNDTEPSTFDLLDCIIPQPQETSRVESLPEPSGFTFPQPAYYHTYDDMVQETDDTIDMHPDLFAWLDRINEARGVLAEVRKKKEWMIELAELYQTLIQEYVKDLRDQPVKLSEFKYSYNIKRFMFFRSKRNPERIKRLALTLCFDCETCARMDQLLYQLYVLAYSMSKEQHHPDTMQGVYNIMLRSRNMLLFHLQQECRDLIWPSFCGTCEQEHVRYCAGKTLKQVVFHPICEDSRRRSRRLAGQPWTRQIEE